MTKALTYGRRHALAIGEGFLYLPATTINLSNTYTNIN